MASLTTEATIVDRGRGPEIAGTRITVFDVMDYLREGWHRDRIASLFRLSSRDIQAAIDYIEQHREEVEADYQQIVERHRNYQYFFYEKHHCNGPSEHAQWLTEPELTRAGEFQVFDDADFNETNDDIGNLYGMRRRENGVIPLLGTRGEQVACFPVTRPPQPWHGYPVWPIRVQRDGDRLRPVATSVLVKFVDHAISGLTIERRIIGTEFLFGPGVGHLLHTHRDLHGAPFNERLVLACERITAQV